MPNNESRRNRVVGAHGGSLIQLTAVALVVSLATLAAIREIVSGDALIALYGAALGIYGGEATRMRERDHAAERRE